MPVKAPIVKAPVVAPPFNWTGCHIGGDVGIVFGRDRDDEIITATGGASPFSPADLAKLNGAKLGGYLGCDWQFASRFVAGIEGTANGRAPKVRRISSPRRPRISMKRKSERKVRSVAGSVTLLIAYCST